MFWVQRFIFTIRELYSHVGDTPPSFAFLELEEHILCPCTPLGFDEKSGCFLPFHHLVREPRRIQVPAIDHEDGWETQIHVQNGGDDNTGAIAFFWGEYSGQCPYSDPGPIGYACKWVAENGLWPLEDQVIPPEILDAPPRELAAEAREKLRTHRPRTLGQAQRIPGITPNDIFILSIKMKRR